jgi:hypothetical protein
MSGGSPEPFHWIGKSREVDKVLVGAQFKFDGFDQWEPN